MQHYQAAGFSEAVSRFTAAPRRPLTNRMIGGLSSVLNHMGKARVIQDRTISDMISSMELQSQQTQ